MADNKIRLIDANKLSSMAKEMYGNAPSVTILKILLDSTPTIEAEPVRHGKWKGSPYNGFGFVCSECNKAMTVRTSFCPHCGAKMDGGDSS